VIVLRLLLADRKRNMPCCGRLRLRVG
jgi:hypothetical protein